MQDQDSGEMQALVPIEANRLPRFHFKWVEIPFAGTRFCPKACIAKAVGQWNPEVDPQLILPNLPRTCLAISDLMAKKAYRIVYIYIYRCV